MHRGQLFSDYFLNEGIRSTAAYQRLAEGEPSFAGDLQQRLERIFAEFPFQGSPDEAQTEDDLICRVLEALGWDRDAWLSQPRAARKGRSDVPDILLFPNADAKRRANAETEKDRRFRHGVAVVESKRWDVPSIEPSKERARATMSARSLRVRFSDISRVRRLLQIAGFSGAS